MRLKGYPLFRCYLFSIRRNFHQNKMGMPAMKLSIFFLLFFHLSSTLSSFPSPFLAIPSLNALLICCYLPPIILFSLILHFCTIFNLNCYLVSLGRLRICGSQSRTHQTDLHDKEGLEFLLGTEL